MSQRTMLLALLVLFALAPVEALARDALIGTWKITLTPDPDTAKAGAKEINDKITFQGGKFVSETWKKSHKFEPVEYEEDTRGGFMSQFKAAPKSKTGGTMQWSGSAGANQIKGEVTWTRPDGTEMKYSFTGEKQ